MDAQVVNCDRRNADRLAAEVHRRLFMILYRRLIKRLTIGGVAIALSLPASGATFRWAGSSNRIYVENGGPATLSDIKAALPNAPLDLVDPVNKVWLLRANLVVEDGVILQLHGTAAGGDVDELRLRSNNSSASNSVVIIDADWGTLDFQETRVTSWDDAVAGPDTEYLVHQRAYVRARSRQVGSVFQESTLNVVNSEVSFLGYNYREGYGLTWQVVSSVSGVQVFGTVSGSSISHCQLGVDTWAVDDVSWTGNEIFENVLYGFKADNPGHQAVLAANDVHDNDFGATFRFSSSNQRIYVTGPGIATLSDIKIALPTVPLALVDPAAQVWHLRANLQIENGAKLLLNGPAHGGDVAELRIQSNNTPASNAFFWVSADWGSLDIRDTKITSWNDAVNGPDTEHSTYNRAYIRVRSSLAPDGVTAREARMDIIDSDIGYLGFNGAEAYGLVWKVIGTHPDPAKDIFDYVDVFGDIRNSRLHHNYYGMYTYGHFGGQWTNNEVDHNYGYGFDPHDDSDSLLIEGNNVHHNGYHGIIASKRCDHLIIRNNLAWSNDKNGIMLHRSCDDSVIENNETYLNKDSGIAIFATFRATIRNNLILSNSNAGIRFSVGGGDSLVEDNDIGYSGQYGVYFYQGSDPAEPGDNGRPKRNVFVNNQVHHSVSEGVKLGDGDENEFIGNTFLANGTVLRFERGVGNRLESNTIPANVIIKSAGTAALPASTFIAHQPLAKVQVDAYSTFIFLDDDGAIFDPEETGLATLAGPSGSLLTLTSAQIGTSSTVITRNLFATTAGASALINPTVWNTGGDLSKRWTVQSASAPQAILYEAGDLLPNASYQILKAGLPLLLTTSDAFGRVAFTDATGSTGSVEYSIVP